MPQISVIVPVYKAEQYLQRSISSVVNQTFTDWELLLVDDGSPDASGQICDEWARKDSRIRVFHKKNGGVSEARNYALDRCRGEWLAFMDSDDWMEPQMLETLYGLVKEYQVPLAVCNFWDHYKDHSKKRDEQHVQTEVLSWQKAVERCLRNEGITSAIWCHLVHHSVYKNLRFVKKHLFEDVDIYSRVFCNAQKLVYTPQPLYNYNHTNPVSITKNGLNYLDNAIALRRVYLFLKRKGAGEETCRQALNVYWWTVFDALARVEGLHRTRRFYLVCWLAYIDGRLANKPGVLEQYRIQRKALCKGYQEFMRCRKEHGYY